MQDYKEVRTGEELDWTQLESYLREALPELPGKMTVSQFHGGHANLTYLLRFADRELVLRRPPFGKIAPGAHDMKREYTVLHGLHPHFAPAPAPILYCSDEEIIGSEFVVMERRTGVVIRKQLPSCFSDDVVTKERLTTALVKVTADLHTVDVAAAGLSELGKPNGFAARQLRGWTKRWHLAKTKENEDVDSLTRDLAENIPDPQRVSIVHGDLKFDNCQFQPDDPDKVSSVFDWDMATLGDPLIDLANLLTYWPDPDAPLTLLEGEWPAQGLILEKYEEFTGLGLQNIAWYQAFTCLKTAVILQQLYARYRSGATKDPRMKHMGKAADYFAHKGRKIYTKKYR